MKQTIKIAVIGGTGKSGKYLVNQLLTQGFELKLLLRNPDTFQNHSPQIQVVYGSVANYEAVYELLEDCQAVISALGLGVPASEPTIFSLSTTHVLRAMKEHAINRYLVITGLNVDAPQDNKSSKTQFATEWMKQHYPISTTNKQHEFEILTKSTVDWTLVRLPLIEQTDVSGPVQVSLEDCPGDTISATSLSNFLIEQLFSDTYFEKSPFIANV
ncbi:NAD(P)-dependent oxidoreductase [Arundinibacter roseus]|uniref:NAD-dependent epimerase/dehydratase family protein n=1 Tax=Arundinibacter roseus TaxID=2070510 RepID=A0A4R4K386_9BACT|nr:NAD(P)H-binding protein [Arundinibacter roseus]TDB61847.1 NAD-dependent epimerase/dehydratase family protein [Arundinibacter roseus]